MSNGFASVFWPPTVLAGILILALTLIVARVYPYARKRLRFKGKASIKLHAESFFIRGLATGISLSSLLVQASVVQPLSPLSGAGIGQLYISLGLLISSGILVSNLKQRLDSYVIPETTTETLSEAPKVRASVGAPDFVLDDTDWRVLNVAEGSYADSMSTMEIAKEAGLDSAVVYQTCLILRDHGYLVFTDEAPSGAALVRITGIGLQAIRDREKFAPKSKETPDMIVVHARSMLETEKVVEIEFSPETTLKSIVMMAIRALNLPPIANLGVAINGWSCDPSSYPQTAKALGITSGSELLFTARATAG